MLIQTTRILLNPEQVEKSVPLAILKNIKIFFSKISNQIKIHREVISGNEKINKSTNFEEPLIKCSIKIALLKARIKDLHHINDIMI